MADLPFQPCQQPEEAGESTRDDVRVLRSHDLLQGKVEVLIEHGPDTYRLRLTRSGKLILQK